MPSPIFLSNLPQISLSKLYKSCSSEDSKQKRADPVLSRAHHEDIVIESPFYERHQNCKGPCQCAYHRMKRYKQMANIVKYQANDKMKKEIDQYKSRIANALRASCNIKHEEENQINRSGFKRIFRQSLDIANIQQNRQLRKKVKGELDNYNQFFEQILRKRLGPLQDYEKVSHLIKFIKLQCKSNPAYLNKSRDYIYAHLLNIVQKIPFDQILQLGDNNSSLLRKIANMLNVKDDVALQFVRAIQKSMSDMQKCLISQVFNRYPSNIGSLSKKGNVQSKSFYEQSSLDENNQSIQYYNQHLRDDQFHQRLQRDSSLINESAQTSSQNKKLKLLLQFGSNKQNSNYELSSSSRRRMGLVSKRSNFSQETLKGLLLKQQSSTPSGFKQAAKEERSISVLAQKNELISQQQKEHYEKKMSFMSRKNSVRKMDHKLNKDQQQSNFVNNASDSKGFKNRKAVRHSKRKQHTKVEAPNCIFNTIQYANLLNKQQFERIRYIIEDSSSMIPESEKMRRIFNLLHKHLNNNPDYLDQFLGEFAKFLSDEQVKILKQKYSDSQFKKMVHKLTKQVDGCLAQLMRSNQLVWRDDDQENTNQGHHVQGGLSLECSNSDSGLIDELSKLKIIEKDPIQMPTTAIEQSLLEQVAMGQIFLQQFLTCKEAEFKMTLTKKKIQMCQQQDENNLSPFKIDEQKHLKILRYMKKRYRSAFQEVKSNVQNALVNKQQINKTMNDQIKL